MAVITLDPSKNPVKNPDRVTTPDLVS
jgi:hypothetical protein